MWVRKKSDARLIGKGIALDRKCACILPQTRPRVNRLMIRHARRRPAQAHELSARREAAQPVRTMPMPADRHGGCELLRDFAERLENRAATIGGPCAEFSLAVSIRDAEAMADFWDSAHDLARAMNRTTGVLGHGAYPRFRLTDAELRIGIHYDDTLTDTGRLRDAIQQAWPSASVRCSRKGVGLETWARDARWHPCRTYDDWACTPEILQWLNHYQNYLNAQYRAERGAPIAFPIWRAGTLFGRGTPLIHPAQPIALICPKCGSARLHKHGNRDGKQRLKCRDCGVISAR